MKIAVIGAGKVGGTLARRFVRLGHEVMLGVRDPKQQKVHELLGSMMGPGSAAAGSSRTAAQSAELVVLTTPWSATEEAVRECGSLDGKIVIDATNPLRLGGGESLEVGFDTSGGELVTGWARGAQVFKTLNQCGWEVMADPVVDGRHAAMFVAGPDGGAKRTVLALVGSLGFEARDLGPIAQARLLEPFGMTWIHTAMRMGLGRDWAFCVVRRPG